MEHISIDRILLSRKRRCIGKAFRIAHLTSEKGKTLNGLSCIVAGFDDDVMEGRMHCRVDGHETVYRIKLTNLVDARANFLKELTSHTALSDNELADHLERALETADKVMNKVFDARLRQEKCQELLLQLRDHEIKPLDGQEYCFPCQMAADEGTESIWNFGFAKAMKFACVGNTSMDLRQVDLGLKGDGRSVCSICSEVLTVGINDTSVTLPCFHVFHRKCIMEWVESDLGKTQWNCPECHAEITTSVAQSCRNYDEKVEQRILGFLEWGLCTKCYIWAREGNNEGVPFLFPTNK